MKVLLKVIVFSLLFVSFYDGLHAQNKKSKASFDLDSTEIMKIRQVFPDLELDRGKMIKIKQLVPKLDSFNLVRIKNLIPTLDDMDDDQINRMKSLLSDDRPALKFTTYPRQDTVIVKGSELHFRFKFDKNTTFIEIEGIGRAGMKDIKAGEWHVTVKPMKTTTYRIIRTTEGFKRGCPLVVKVVKSEAEQKKVLDEMEQESKRRREASKNGGIIRFDPSSGRVIY